MYGTVPLGNYYAIKATLLDLRKMMELIFHIGLGQSDPGGLQLCRQ